MAISSVVHIETGRRTFIRGSGRCRVLELVGPVARLLAIALPMIAWSSAFALDPSRALTQYNHRIWQVPQGLPQASVHAVRQTRDGFLWLGTQTGLVRFDGVHFTPITTVDNVSLDRLWITSLTEDHDGALWVSTEREGLFRIAQEKATHFTHADGLPSDAIQGLVTDFHGTVWAATDRGLAKFSKGRWTAITLPPGVTDVRAIATSADGKLWIAGPDASQIYEYDGSTFTHCPLIGAPPFTSVQAMLSDRDGRMLIGTSQGLFILSDGKQRRLTAADGLADNWVYCLCNGAEDSLWVGTKNGFSRVREDGIECFRASDGLSQSDAFCITEDREGTLWVGTKHGLNQFLDRRAIPFTKSEGLSSNNTGAVFQDHNGTLWVGTLDAGLCQFDGRRFDAAPGITTRDGLPSNRIVSLAEDQSGALWAGTNHGICRFAKDVGAPRTPVPGSSEEPGRSATKSGSSEYLRTGVDSAKNIQSPRVVQTISSADGLASNNVTCLLSDANGVLWVGTSAGVSTIRDHRVVHLPGLESIAGNRILALGTSHGAVMVATDEGLFRYTGAKLLRVAGGEPGSSDARWVRNIDAIYEDHDGLLWIGTRGNGLRLIDGDRQFSFSIREGLFDDDIYGIIADDQDRLWMACSQGVFWVKRSELRSFAAGHLPAVTSNPFSPTDNLRTVECQPDVQPVVCSARDGKLWFATAHGLIVFDPAHLLRRTLVPDAVIEDFVVNGQHQNPTQRTELSPGQENLEFRYTGLSFAIPTRMQFRYELEGFDKKWVDAGTRREAFYTNLSPGEYRFKVMAANPDSGFGDSPATVGFTLLPRFYQRLWFFPLVVVSVLAVVVLMYRRRMRRIRLQIAAIVAERSRIARELHDTLLQGFSGVTMEMQALLMRLRPEHERAILEGIIQDAADCMREARRSVAGLRSVRGEEGLAAAISQSATQLTETTKVRLRLKLSEKLPVLSPETEYNILRIAHESVANAVNHAGASWVEVALSESSGELLLSVRDDGCGFDPSIPLPGQHYGLIGIRERANQIDAGVEVDSRVGKGTVVTLKLPVKQRDQVMKSQTPRDQIPIKFQ